jgi:hypothetical protein
MTHRDRHGVSRWGNHCDLGCTGFSDIHFLIFEPFAGFIFVSYMFGRSQDWVLPMNSSILHNAVHNACAL